MSEEAPDLSHGKTVRVMAKIIDPPDHNGFIKVAVQTGYTPEPEIHVEIHASCVKGFPPAG